MATVAGGINGLLVSETEAVGGNEAAVVTVEPRTTDEEVDVKGRRLMRAGRAMLATVALVAVAVAALGIIGAPASSGGARPRPATWVTVRGLTDLATLTSTCGVGENGGAFCQENDDGFLGRLPVRPRDVVRVRTRPGAGRVTAHLVRLRANGEIADWIEWEREAREVAATDGRRWRFRLPGDLENANAIHLFMRYPGGAAYPGGDTVTQATYTSRIRQD